jgi:hypothetical protein
VNKIEFANLLFRLEELLAETDLWRQKIGECDGDCKGSLEEDYRKLCASCHAALMKELDALRNWEKIPNSTIL